MSLTGNRHAILVISPPFILLFSHSPSVWWWKNLGKTRKKTWHPIIAKKNLACSIHEITSQRRCTWRRHLPGRAHRQSPSPGEDRSPPSSAASAPAQSLGPRGKKNAVSLGKPWWNGDFGANADLTGDNGDLTRKKCGSAREKSDSTRKKMWFNKGKWWCN